MQEIISYGGETRRSEEPVATTRVRVRIPDEKDRNTCIEAIRSSDVALALKANSDYEWNVAVVNDDTIQFGVSWYSVPFFKEKKNAFTSKEHFRIFSDFNATADDFEVIHYVALKRANEFTD